MRSIAIIGAGQSGLCLALSLHKSGYKVTLYSNRTPKEIKEGHVLSTQAIFHDGLQFERKWNLNYWDKECPVKDSVIFTLGVPGKPEPWLHWVGKPNHIFQSVDQRIKFSHLMEEFEKAGGKLVIQDVGVNELNEIAKDNDLTIVAGGKGEISQLFPRDDKRSTFDKPMRALTVLYVNGIAPREDSGVGVNLIPGVGEYFTLPVLSLTGPCTSMFFEGIVGGPFDCFKGITDPQEQLKIALELLQKFVPWEAERCQNVELIDKMATLSGRYPPTIREPVAKLPSGKHILGMADTVVLNDPIAGQGSNNATHCADIYLRAITERGDKEFDEAWMREVFEEFWKKSGEPSTTFSNMLLQPPPPHVIELLTAGTKNPLIADKFANAFESPASMFPWILDPEQTKGLISELNEKYEAGKGKVETNNA